MTTELTIEAGNAVPSSRAGNARLSIAEISARTGLTKDTLRWYEKEGLIPPVPRTANGYRAYDEQTERWVILVLRLRRTGMPVEQAREFIRLVAAGAASHGRRMALLAEHRERVVAHIAQLTDDLTAVDNKIDHYAALIDAGLDCDGSPVLDPAVRQAQRSTR